MKTNFYIILILLLSFSLSNAQSNDKVEKTVSSEVVETLEDNKVEIIDVLKIKEAISKTSDIRNFLNRERNVENIKLVFPKINRRKTA